MLDNNKVTELRGFIDLLESNPNLIHSEDLGFFREYLTSMGAHIPPVHSGHDDGDDEFHDVEDIRPEEPKESDFFDDSDSGKIDAETETMPPTAQPRELSESDQDRLNDLKAKATDAVEDCDRAKALLFLNDAVSMGGSTAMLLTRRADILLKQKRPLAAIADCDAALSLNPDSGKAYRIRGLAYRALQRWERSHADLAMAQTIDFDDSVEDVKKFVDEKWKIISNAKREYKLKLDEYNKKKAEARMGGSSSSSPRRGPAGMPGGFPGGMPGGMPGGFPGGMPGGFPANLMGDIMSDPEMMAAFSNPKVMQAMTAMMSNPAAIFQYQNDPEVGPILMKLMSKMGGMGGMGK